LRARIGRLQTFDSRGRNELDIIDYSHNKKDKWRGVNNHELCLLLPPGEQKKGGIIKNGNIRMGGGRPAE